MNQLWSVRIEFCLLKSDIVLFAKREQWTPLKNKKKNPRKLFCVTDCSFLSLDSSCRVRKCGRPAALVCVCARDRLLPFGKHLDQCRGAAYRAWTNQRGLLNLVLMTAAWQLVLNVIIEGQGFICHLSWCFFFMCQFLIFFYSFPLNFHSFMTCVCSVV